MSSQEGIAARPLSELRIDYAGELNEQQLLAVTAPPQAALVVAGAGSGKTRTLTYRVAYLIEQGIAPERILLLTFTNKAAGEMMRRVNDLLGEDLSRLWGGTFHSVGNRVLRKHAEMLGFGRDFTILDQEDALNILKNCMTAERAENSDLRFPKADVAAEIFSLAVNTRRSVTDVVLNEFEHFHELTEALEKLAAYYRREKKERNVVDFDDLLILWLRLLNENEGIRQFYQERFRFILVDEYQDTNKLQGELIDLLAAKHRNVMVVGDDAQSIYSWRGANFQNILGFPERYPGAAIYRIEINYRSTPEILALANAVIAHNVCQYEKRLTAARSSGQKPILAKFPTAEDQAAFIAYRVMALHEEGIALDRMAVLYRSHFHALELQLELIHRNIPTLITSGIRFFEQAHIKDVVGYLRLIANPWDDLAFKRVVQLLPRIGSKSADRLWSGFKHSLGQNRPLAPGRLPQLLVEQRAHVPNQAQAGWAQFVATIAQLEQAEIRSSPSKMISLILDAGYEDHVIESYAKARNRLEDLENLVGFSRRFSSVEEFLSELALLTSPEEPGEASRKSDEPRLRLSTIHQAKGLEFDAVFVIMLCEGLFPNRRAMDEPNLLEEERRLFYVAVTRAKDELCLTYPMSRFRGGDSGPFQKSRFLREFPLELVDSWETEHNGPF